MTHPSETGDTAARQASTSSDAIELWCEELMHHLEIEGVSPDLESVTSLATQAQTAIGDTAGGPTAFLVGYVSGLAEASGQADFATAHRAATRVAERLLRRRSEAVG